MHAIRTALVVAIVLAGQPAARAESTQAGVISGSVSASAPRYLADTFVYLKRVEGAYPARTVTIDQKGLSFMPHMVTATVGDQGHFENHDGVYHNVFSKDHGGYNVGTFGPGQSGNHLFDKEGVFAQLCSIHPEMLGYVFVGQNPFATSVDKQGRFRIEGVPPGHYQIAVWNPQLLAGEQAVSVAAGKQTAVNFEIHR